MGQDGVTYCALGPGTLSKLQTPVNNFEAERITLDTPEPTETPAVTETPQITEAPAATPAVNPQETQKTAEDMKTAVPEDDKPDKQSGDGSSGGKGGCGGFALAGTVLPFAAVALIALKKTR